jgi:hypothetical protein
MKTKPGTLGYIDACLDRNYCNVVCLSIAHHASITRGPSHNYPEDLYDHDVNPFDDTYYIDIPTPFKRGDILAFKSRSAATAAPKHVYVLDSFERPTGERLTSSDSGDGGDGPLLARCYCVSGNGQLREVFVSSYDSLEYYHYRPEDTRTLSYPNTLYDERRLNRDSGCCSEFLKGWIGPPEFLAKYTMNFLWPKP